MLVQMCAFFFLFGVQFFIYLFIFLIKYLVQLFPWSKNAKI